MAQANKLRRNGSMTESERGPPLPGTVVTLDDISKPAPQPLTTRRFSSLQKIGDAYEIHKQIHEPVCDNEPKPTIAPGRVKTAIKNAQSDEGQVRTAISIMQGRNLTADFLTTLFQKYDADKSGSIEVNELSAIIRSLGITLSDKALMHLYSQVDSDNNGAIDVNEFLDFFAKMEEMDDVRNDMITQQQRNTFKSRVFNVIWLLNIISVFVLAYLYMNDQTLTYKTLLVVDCVICGFLVSAFIIAPLTMAKFRQHDVAAKSMSVAKSLRTTASGMFVPRPVTVFERRIVPKPKPPELKFSYRIKEPLEENLVVEDITDIPMQVGSPYECYRVRDFQAAREAQERDLQCRGPTESFQALHAGRITTMTNGASLTNTNIMALTSHRPDLMKGMTLDSSAYGGMLSGPTGTRSMLELGDNRT